ncbi:MAG: hypothetical protein AB7Q97_20795 [Gammaproteobacteria bacterium]
MEPPPPDSAADIAGYEHAVAEAEARGGAYGAEAVEALVGLGLAQRAAGNHAGSLAALRRALYVSRINEGLHHPRQVDLLERIIEAQGRLGDWRGVDDSFHYMLWVLRRSYPAGDPRLMLAADRIGRWHLQATALDAPSRTGEHIATARHLLAYSLQNSARFWAPEDPRLLGPLRADAAVQFRIAEMMQAGLAEEPSIHRLARYRGSSDFERIRMEQHRFVAQAEGTKALERVVRIEQSRPDRSAREIARALLDLGDWNLQFFRYSQARDAYARAHAALVAGGTAAAEIDALLGTPRPIDNLYVDPVVPVETPVAGARVVLVHGVDEYGVPSRPRVVEEESVADDELRRQARSALRGTRFRPALQDGRPRAVSDLRFEKVFPAHTLETAEK